MICNALGFEGMLAQRPFRELARRLARNGATVLRFDYSGTGDSLGAEWFPSRVKSWLDDVGDAVAMVAGFDDVDRIDLVGFRMGAAFAAMFAAEHPTVSRLALWAPVIKGKSYARELRALSRLSAAGRPTGQPANPDFPEDSLEVVGYEFTAETIDDLKLIDIEATGVGQVGEILLLDRDDAPAGDDVVASLGASGANLTRVEVRGYQDFQTDDETKSVWPSESLDQLDLWLGREPRAQIPLPVLGRPESSMQVTIEPSVDHILGGSATDTGRSCNERADWVADRMLVVVSRPAPPVAARPTVLLLTTGSNNRSGPGRMYVNFARYWASLGHTVVRADLGGAGDSVATEPDTENRPYAPVRIQEVRLLVDWASRLRSGAPIVLFGVCSGGYNAFHAALAGASVSGIVMVNPLIFHTGEHGEASQSPDHHLMSAAMLSRGLMSSGRWKSLVAGERSVRGTFDRVRSLIADGALRGMYRRAVTMAANALQRLHLIRRPPPPVIRDIRRLSDAEVEVVTVFSADEPGIRILRGTGGPAFQALVEEGRLEVVELDGGDHVVSPPGARRSLLEYMTEYLERPRSTPSHQASKGKTSSWISN